MREPQSTTAPSQDALSLALETLGDEVAALRADLAAAIHEAETWRTIALGALNELHEATVDRDRPTSRTADVEGIAS